MGLLEETFIVTDDAYESGCGLQDYRGTVSLCAAKKGDSKTFLKWVFPQKYDKDTKVNFPGDKAFPMSIAVGDGRKEAAKVLRHWADVLDGGEPPNDQAGQTVANDDIPF